MSAIVAVVTVIAAAFGTVIQNPHLHETLILLAAVTGVAIVQNPLLLETLIGLAEAAKKIPSFRGGRPTNPSTVFRWIRECVSAPMEPDCG